MKTCTEAEMRAFIDAYPTPLSSTISGIPFPELETWHDPKRAPALDWRSEAGWSATLVARQQGDRCAILEEGT